MSDADLHLPGDGPTCTQSAAIVLGAGVSGLVSAAILAKQGHRPVTIIDEYDHLGGNHIDWTSEGYTFDVGSLIFQDDSPFLTHFPKLLPLYVPIKPRWGRLNPQGKVTTYPISPLEDIFRAGPLEIGHILASVLYARICQRQMRNAKDFARYWIGSYLLWRSGLESYMRRFYGIDADKIDIEFAKKRMLWISEHASLKNLLARANSRAQSGRRNTQLARPYSGFGVLYRTARQQLEDSGVEFKLCTDVRSIKKDGALFHVYLGNQEIQTPRLISTIPLDKIQALCGLRSGQKLETITLISLFFSFCGKRGFDQSVLYNFSHYGAWKRLTVYSDFYGQVNDREYFGVEVIADHVQGMIGDAEADFRRHVGANNLFDGDLRLEGSNILSNAYPIYRQGAAGHAAEIIQNLRDLGVESFGRQGAFNYQPTSRVSTLDAEAALGFKRVCPRESAYTSDTG